MSPREIIDLQLDAIFGKTMPTKVQAMVDAELNAGRWHEGYDIAINPRGLSQHEGQQLLEVILGQHAELKIDAERLLETVCTELPQSIFVKVHWIAAADGTFILEDSLRVGRFRNSEPIWISPRISLDGIELDSVDSEFVRGRSFWLDSYYPDMPFALSFENGAVLDGQIVEW